MNDYFNCVYGWWCCWNKLYLREFLLKNKILFPTGYAEDRMFSIYCSFYARRYVKIPFLLNVYRNHNFVSISRQPAGVDNLKEEINNFVEFAIKLEKCTKDISGFHQNPEYKFKLLDAQLSDVVPQAFRRYYFGGALPINEVLENVESEIEKIFGKNASFIKWLFHRYHLLYQQNQELIARLRSQK